MKQDIFNRKLETLHMRFTKKIAQLHDNTELRIEQIESLLHEYQDGIIAACKKAY